MAGVGARRRVAAADAAASAFTSMLPFHPPLPVAWNLPFHPEEGSQTSILMSESGDGLSVAATRQNAGRSVNCAPPPRPPPCGGVNAPRPLTAPS
jgi:hypothetical protein